QRSRVRVKQRDTVQASASRGQLSLLPYHIVGHEKDLAALQPLARRELLRLLLLACVQDSDPLASVAENGNALESFFICIHIQALCLFHRKSVRHIHSRTNGSIDVCLPY